MTNFTELFKPEALFSADNPALKATKKAHELAFETFNKTAGLQLDFARDMLDINSKRFNALYAGNSVADSFSTNTDLALEVSNKSVRLLEDINATVNDFQDAAKDTITGFVAEAQNSAKPASKANRKAKAA